MILGTEKVHPHALTNEDFDELFTKDRPIHFNYHGYAGEIKGLLFERPQVERISIESYREEGSTTTPFDMMLLNHVSRFHVAEYALIGGAKANKTVQSGLDSDVNTIQEKLRKVKDYIYENRTGKNSALACSMPVNLRYIR